MPHSRIIASSAHELPQEHAFNGVDLVKFVCAFLICMIHIFPFQTDWLGLKFLNIWIRDGLCRFAVPFYFVSSGFLLFRKAENGYVRADRIRGFAFKNLRLLGTWYILLILGSRVHLWFLGALVMATLLTNLSFKARIKPLFIGILSVLLYVIGMLGTTYHSLIVPLKAHWVLKMVISGYEFLFTSTRNGAFFGFIFVFMGALFAQKKIVLRKRTAILGLVVSYAFLILEVYLQHRFDTRSDHLNDMYVFLVPVTFFLFYLASHMILQDRPVYKRMRAVGVLIFFVHQLVDYVVIVALDNILRLTGIDMLFCHFTLSIVFTVLLAVMIERLSETGRLRWLKYLYA